MWNEKPVIISELEDLISQATAERSHYYVRNVANKAVLAIGMLMQERDQLRALADQMAGALEWFKDTESYYSKRGKLVQPAQECLTKHADLIGEVKGEG